jgi:hypothetical protein
MRDRTVEVSHLERQVAQATGLGARRALRRLGKREQFHLCAAWQGQIQLPALALGPEMLVNQAQAEHAQVKVAGASVIGRDQCHMVETADA